MLLSDIAVQKVLEKELKKSVTVAPPWEMPMRKLMILRCRTRKEDGQ
jgi:hypothetical protein